MKLKKILITAVLFFLAGIFSLYARDVEITVLDMDLGLPLEGAVIRSADGRQYRCDKNGKALVTVPDKQSVIQAGYPGYDNFRLIITPERNSYTINLRLSGIIEGRELVIEAEKPGTSETRTGRSVGISGKEISQTAEIGIVEDVISSIKLLPGVGYTGMMNARPSIRGGDPMDMRASLDGFYIFMPYHLGGSFSIFDPRMVESAQLSHGVFSTRFGNSISGLLDITSKDPSSTEAEFELGGNTSSANFNLSVPLFGKGGILFIGRVTYYDPIIALAKEIVNANNLTDYDEVNAIKVAPYIRSGTISGNYHFLDNLELTATGFFGMDGAGMSYENSFRTDKLKSDSSIDAYLTNYNSFFTSGLAWNPRNDMLLKFRAGVGYQDEIIDAAMANTIHGRTYEKTDANKWYYDTLKAVYPALGSQYSIDTDLSITDSNKMVNVQGRLDYDWEIGKGFLVSMGAQELFIRSSFLMDNTFPVEAQLKNLKEGQQDEILNAIGVTNPVYKAFLKENMRVSLPAQSIGGDNELRYFLSSGYGLVEYTTPNNRFNTELGLRVDHFYMKNNDLSLQSKAVLNPRINMDFNFFKNKGIIDSWNVSAGTGLFSSINEVGATMEEDISNAKEFKPSRSWTSVVGTKLDFHNGITFNIEGYYKYIFDRTYMPIQLGIDEIKMQPQNDGEGRAWGIDIMLQKMQSRFWDGWISYSYNWTRYQDPQAGNMGFGLSGGAMGSDQWYYPNYHRFHNLNLVLNIKPKPQFNIYTRFGIASGAQIQRRIGDGPISYPVYVYDSNNPGNNKFIEKFYWPSVRDENNRSTPALPWDIKFSIYGNNKKGKTQYEVYVAVENILGMVTSKGNTSFNQYTGEMDTGSLSGSYGIPVPIPSFGFKISY